MASGTFRFAVLRAERTLAAWEVTSVTRLRELGGELAAIVVASGADRERGLIERTAERLARPKGRATLSGPEPASVMVIRLGSQEALEAVRALELDLILAFEPTGTFLSSVGDPDRLARRGIWTHAFAVSGDPAHASARVRSCQQRGSVSSGLPRALGSVRRREAARTRVAARGASLIPSDTRCLHRGSR